MKTKDEAVDAPPKCLGDLRRRARKDDGGLRRIRDCASNPHDQRVLREEVGLECHPAPVVHVDRLNVGDRRGDRIRAHAWLMLLDDCGECNAGSMEPHLCRPSEEMRAPTLGLHDPHWQCARHAGIG